MIHGLEITRLALLLPALQEHEAFVERLWADRDFDVRRIVRLEMRIEDLWRDLAGTLATTELN